MSRECIIVEPRSSKEVRERYAKAFAERSLLKLTLLPNQEVPPPEPFDVLIDISFTKHPEYGQEGVTTLIGPQVDEQGQPISPHTEIVIHTPTDPTATATATVVG